MNNVIPSLTQNAASLNRGRSSQPWYRQRSSLPTFGEIVRGGNGYRANIGPSLDDVKELRKLATDLGERIQNADPEDHAEQNLIQSEIRRLTQQSQALESRANAQSVYDKIADEHERIKSRTQSFQNNAYGGVYNLVKSARGPSGPAFQHNSAFLNAFRNATRYG